MSFGQVDCSTQAADTFGRRHRSFILRRSAPLTVDTFCTYEQHFGLSGPAFSTTPDPDFYFASRGHHQAFTHLSHAVLAGECFMVVTGDTGAGKTMLVRKLLRGLESEGIVAALSNDTARDARDLLLTILSSFRTPVFGSSLDELRGTLHAFLTTLASIDRKALIVIDEAQQLPPDAIEELIDFATPQWTPDDVPLQVLLVGQPALRMSLPNMAQVTRRPTFLFCDIGLLSRSETRSYIEHRLQHVQWGRSPSFSDEAHDRIYRATDGVPRDVNRLCHRVLIAASRQQQTSISPELVEEAYASLREETGDIAPVDDANHAAQPLASESSASSTPANDA